MGTANFNTTFFLFIMSQVLSTMLDHLLREVVDTFLVKSMHLLLLVSHKL